MRWNRWILALFFRSLFATILTYTFSHSFFLSGWLFFAVWLQSLLRYRLSVQIAEFESLWIVVSMVVSLLVIGHFQLAALWTPKSIASSQLAALCIMASTLLVVVRGGTYIVRGILTKSNTLPSESSIGSKESRISTGSKSEPPGSIAAAEEHITDTEEYNRGRLIGNLERIILTIVVAAGSYSALAFLVAAKGIVRSEEFQSNRDFAEYFLVGSFSSALVAVCGGIALRFALLRLWPDLLNLQIQ